MSTPNVAPRKAPWSRRLIVFTILIIAGATTTPVVRAQSEKAKKFLEDIDKQQQELDRKGAERRQRNLEADRTLCVKSKDPALCEMLATRLRGIEQSLGRIDAGLSSGLSSIETAISDVQLAIRSRP
jgi:hypothetical protein